MTSKKNSTASSQRCTCFALRKLTRTVSRLYDQHLAAVGLKTTQYSLLKNIAIAPLPVAELAARIGTERTTVTRNLKPLIDAGWVGLNPGADTRQRIVSITSSGRAKIRSARQAWLRAQAELETLLGIDTVLALHAGIDTALTQLNPLFEEHAHAEPI
ncbi:MarR family transcriptional regulator [soil metagenome]